MKWIVSSIAAGALALGALPALAGGPVAVPPAPAPAPAPMPPAPVVGNWTGFSAGLGIGYAAVSFGADHGHGLIYGVQGAYDYDFGSWVLGIIGSYDAATRVGVGAGTDELLRLGRLGVRGGLDLGKTYVYAAGGAALASMDLGGIVKGHGWFAGVGADYMLTPNWSLGVQLFANQFKNFNSSGNTLRANTASLNVSYRF